jgi:hypothetical protein
VACVHPAGGGGGGAGGVRVPAAGRDGAPGALNLYRDTPGPLTGDQHADALVVAAVTARWVLEAQADMPPDTVAEELEAGADFHFAVHNAAGMVSVQEDISVTEALIRPRAHAFSHDRLLADVAQDIITGRLRLS